MNEAEREIVRKGQLFRRLEQNADFKAFLEVVSDRSTLLMKELMERKTASDADVYASERAKGALHFIDWLFGLPSTTIGEMQDILKREPDGEDDLDEDNDE